MWGYKPIEIWAEDENKTKVHYRRQEKPMGSFQIISRRTFTAGVTRIPLLTSASTPAPNPQRSSSLHTQRCPSSLRAKHSEKTSPKDGQSENILFLKSAWPETKHRKGPEVIIEAHKRAEALLGTEADSVTDHLPVLVDFKELAYTSTQIIRCLVKSTITMGFVFRSGCSRRNSNPSIPSSPVIFGRPFGIHFDVSLSFFLRLKIDEPL